jgi:2-keto-3-deoxy-L-rhamnonate aldolase RhmA
MSDRIAEAFAAARADGRAALMPYLMGGFPDVPTSEAIADAYAEAGADLVELGIPFSDPLADGPVIHAAGTRALAAGASFDSVLPVCRRIADRVPVVPMVYANMVLARGPAEVGAALANAGAAGVIVPMVNSPEEAAAAVGACRYPPAGYRSWGPTRAALGTPDFSPELANRSVVCAVMVETVPALERLGEIVSVPGVDVVFIGPSDFAISMGFAPRSDEAEHRRRLEAVPEVCREHGVVAGIACGSLELLGRWRQAGYTMLAAPSDMVLLRQAATAMLNSARQ